MRSMRGMTTLASIFGCVLATRSTDYDRLANGSLEWQPLDDLSGELSLLLPSMDSTLSHKFECTTGMGSVAGAYKETPDTTIQSCAARCDEDVKCASFDFTTSSSGHVSVHTLQWWRPDNCRLFDDIQHRGIATPKSAYKALGLAQRQHCNKFSANPEALLGPMSCRNPRSFIQQRYRWPEPGSIFSRIGVSRSALSEDAVWPKSRLAQYAAIAEAVYTFAEVPGWNLAKWYEFGPTGSSAHPEDCAWHQNVAVYEKPSEECVVAFAGTDSHGSTGIAPIGILMKDGDWIDNANKDVIDFCGFPGVHAGYSRRMERFFSVNGGQVVSSLSEYISDNCKGEATLVGHSMGGALATLMAACANRRQHVEDENELWYDKSQYDQYHFFRAVGLYTFGAPGVTRKYKRSSTQAEFHCLLSGHQSQLSDTDRSAEREKHVELRTRSSTSQDAPNEEWCEAIPLRNSMTEDGCFPGLRIYTQDGFVSEGILSRVDPIPAKSSIEGYKHAMLAALRLGCRSPQCWAGNLASSEHSLLKRGQFRSLDYRTNRLECSDPKARVLPINLDVEWSAILASMIDMHDQMKYVARLLSIQPDLSRAKAGEQKHIPQA